MRTETALLATTALHLGFQAVVTVVVYPALAELPPDRWDVGHDAHSRRIMAVVAPVYVLLAGACAWVLLADARSSWSLLAVGSAAATVLVTATVAAPTHSRLGTQGPRPELLRRLLRADRVRLAFAMLAFACAAVAAG